jgi:RHS repeat-associated protein
MGTEELVSASYTYDGDGNMVKSVVNGVTTYFVGGIYELEDDGQNETERKYYSAGSKRIALRVDGTLTWLLGDHLGSTSVTADASGAFQSEIRYTAFGETRYENGTTPTDYQYTGQRKDRYIKLYFYKARWYDPVSAHFTQADTIIPKIKNPKSLNRYSYTYQNPIKYTDSTGHCTEGSDDYEECMETANKIENKWHFIDVVVCVGDDVANGCSGWTAEEMFLLYLTISEFNFEISTASIKVIREGSDLIGTIYEPNEDVMTYDIRIGNRAWKTAPKSGELDYQFYNLFSSKLHFQGTIAHELTHVAIGENPNILDEWMKEINNRGINLPNFRIGKRYDTSDLKNRFDNPEIAQQEEWFCIVNSSMLYEPVWNPGKAIMAWFGLDQYSSTSED